MAGPSTATGCSAAGALCTAVVCAADVRAAAGCAAVFGRAQAASAWVAWMLRMHTHSTELQEFCCGLEWSDVHIEAIGQSFSPKLPGSSPTVRDRSGTQRAVPTLAVCAPNLPAAPAAVAAEDPQSVRVHDRLLQLQQGPAERAGKRRTRRKCRTPDLLEQTSALARDGRGSSDGGAAHAVGSDCNCSRGVQDTIH
jgi:hypothetical protein